MQLRFLSVVCALGMLASAHAQRSGTALSLRPESMDAVNTDIKAVQHKGRTALQLLPLAGKEQGDEDMLAIVPGASFKDGTIELEVAGAPRADAKPAMRGFIGIAFRVQGKGEKFECFYLRPANGRADNQLQRNHSLQYISSPEYGWKRLRTEHPGEYESYADLAAGEWTKLKIVVSGTKAQLFVNGASQPALVVNDLKLGPSQGAIALWSHTSTDGYFANLKGHAMKKLILIFVLTMMAASAFADSSITKQRTVTQLAEGVYMIRHPDAPDTFPQGNTTVIIGDRGVFVVDSCYLPSSAREDIAQIKQWTSKPVLWLLNTHWHNDHVEGNGAYKEAFPQVNIVAHYQTARQVAGYIPNYPSRFPAIQARYQKMIDTGKDLDGNDIPPTQITDLRNALAGKATVLKEFETNTVVPPNITFDREMTVDLGNREVQIKHLGRGNTAGDAIVYLPKEKIVVAGDLLDSPVPYLGGGYPADEIETLKKMAALAATTIVPGHGDVLHDKVLLNDVIDFLQAVTTEMSKQIYVVGNGPRNLDAVRKNVMQSLDLEKWRKKLGGTSQEDREFFESFSLNGVITAAYAGMWGR